MILLSDMTGKELIKHYQDKAIDEAERRGVVQYEVRANTMTYDANYPLERCTYRVIINLNTGKETRKERPKYYKSGNANMYC